MNYSGIQIQRDIINNSLVKNYDSSNVTFYLLMAIHKFSGGTWTNDTIILDDSSPRVLQPNETLSFVSLWNSNAATVSGGTGTYRAYIAVTDENNVPLLDKDSSYLIATYNFSVWTSGTGTEEEITINTFESLHEEGTLRIFGISAQNTGDLEINTLNWTITPESTKTHAKDIAVLQKTEDILIFYQHNFSATGIYNANATVFGEGSTDTEFLQVNINAIQVTSLAELYQGSTLRNFRFVIENNAGTDLSSLNWTLHTGDELITAQQFTQLQSQEDIFIFTQHNYTSSGEKTVNATGINATISHSQNISVNI